MYSYIVNCPSNNFTELAIPIISSEFRWLVVDIYKVVKSFLNGEEGWAT